MPHLLRRTHRPRITGGGGGGGGSTAGAWLHRTAGALPRNGTSSHTITFGADGDAPFTPTDGRLLVVIVAGAMTMTWPGGWTERLQALDNTELSVATITAASTSSVTITHSRSDYAANFVAYEFPAGTTWVDGATATGVANGSPQANPTVTGLPGTPVEVFYAASQDIVATGGAVVSATWSGATEDLDLFTDAGVSTDGDWLGVAYQSGVTATTSTATPTITNERTVATERVTFALALGAPLAAFTLGTQVGVPTGTSLTATSGLPTQDATVSFSRTDPITGAAVSLSGVKKWTARSWAATLSGTVPSGEVWWFDQCAFTPTSNSFFCVDVDTSNGANSRLSPTLIFTNCTFGPGAAASSDKATDSNRAWIENCDINQPVSGQGKCEDGWIGAAYCTVIASNIRAGIGLNSTDPHSDGVQMTDTGGTAFYRCWLDGGQMTSTLTGNSAIRVGTEFGATDGVDLFYCGIGGRSANNVQFRSDNGPTTSPITNVRFRGNRWCSDGAAFLYDFQQEAGGGTMITEWSDNQIGVNCTIGGVAYTAGDVVASPGV